MGWFQAALDRDAGKSTSTLLGVAAALSSLLEPGLAARGAMLLREDAVGALHCPARGVRVARGGRRGASKLLFTLRSGLIETAGGGLRSG